MMISLWFAALRDRGPFLIYENLMEHVPPGAHQSTHVESYYNREQADWGVSFPAGDRLGLSVLGRVGWLHAVR
jgi:hypothetical protein